MRYDFNLSKSHYFNKSELTVNVGNKFDLIQRTNINDNVQGSDITYDTQNSKIFKTPHHLILLKGSIQYKQYWNNINDIVSDDLERYKDLTSNDKIRLGNFSQTSTLDAIANKELITTYSFGADYDNFSLKSNTWALATPTEIMAQKDDTRLFCFISDEPYGLKIIDIDVGQTKTINKSQENEYLFFSTKCSVENTNIVENDLKQLTSNTIKIKNESDIALRIIKVSF